MAEITLDTRFQWTPRGFVFEMEAALVGDLRTFLDGAEAATFGFGGFTARGILVVMSRLEPSDPFRAQLAACAPRFPELAALAVERGYLVRA